MGTELSTKRIIGQVVSKMTVTNHGLILMGLIILLELLLLENQELLPILKTKAARPTAATCKKPLLPLQNKIVAATATSVVATAAVVAAVAVIAAVVTATSAAVAVVATAAVIAAAAAAAADSATSEKNWFCCFNKSNYCCYFCFCWLCCSVISFRLTNDS